MSSKEHTLSRSPVLCKKRRVLCVEDDKDTIELLRVVFEFAGYYVKTAETAALAMSMLGKTLFDVYLLDNRLPDMSGLDLVQKIRAFDPSTPIILASGDAREEERQRAIMLGAQAYLTKPWEPDFLLATVQNLIKKADRARLRS